VDNDPTGDLGLAGFKLGADGILQASNGVFNGIVNAASGTFQNVDISDTSIFRGIIQSGPLLLSDENPSSIEFSFAAGTNPQTIYTTVQSYLGNTGQGNFIYPVVGSYNAKNVITITLSYSTGYFTKYEVDLSFSDSTYQRFTTNMTISYELKFRLASGGKTLKITDLPDGPTSPGVLYQNNGVLMIT
jgi:hypothetical protein